MIFVTGGSGLVGSFLLAELVKRGERVRACYRHQPPVALPYNADPAAVEWVEGDVLDPFFLNEAVRDTTVVYHCAAVVSYAPRDAAHQWAVNVHGTANVVNACLTHAPTARLGYVSSVAAVGRPPGQAGVTVTEEARWNADEEHSAYAESKYAAELEVWRGISEGLAAVMVNPSVILGPGDWSRSSTQLFRYVAQGHRYYAPGLVNVVDVRDVVTALIGLTTSDNAVLLNQRYILSAATLPFEEFFRLLGAALAVKPPTTPLPPLLAEVLWRVEHVRGWLTGGAPLITRDTARLARTSVGFNAKKIQQALGLTFHGPAESIGWVARELRRQQPAG